MSSWNAVTWDVSRAGGMMAYALLTLSVVLGLALSLRWQRPQWPRLITNEMHSFLTLLSLVFIAIHGVAIWLDPFMHFGWREVFVPLASHYRPLWMALGIVAGYLCLAVWVSTQLRPRIGYAWWRRLHTLTFAVYVLSTAHGLATGSDTRTTWALGLYAGSVLLVGLLLSARLLTPIGTRGTTHPRLAALAAGIIGVGILWTATGPMRPGWPTFSAARPSGSTAVATTAGALRPFTAPLQGTFTLSQPDASGVTTIQFMAHLNDGTRRSLQIDLQGQQAPDGSFSVSGTQVTLIAASGAALYQGQLSSLSGGSPWQMSGTLAGLGGQSGSLDVTIVLQVTNGGQVTGSLQATPV